MEHRHQLPKVGGEHPQQLGRQGDLRDQYHGGLPPGQHLLDQADIDLGLSAAGDAVQQGGARLPPEAEPVQAAEGRLLLLI